MAKGWKLSIITRIERFLSNVNGGEGCWEWIGFVNEGGYGRYKWQDRKNHLAHRLMYALCFGDFDDTLDICHHCDNRRCVNPEHLFIGTATDNIHDMIRKGRQRYVVGEESGSSKLTVDNVREIRRLRANGYTQEHIGRLFGVSHPTIGCICREETWKHVT